MTDPIPPSNYITDLRRFRSALFVRSLRRDRLTALVAGAETVEDLQTLWAEAVTHGVADKPLQNVFRTRRDELTEGAPA